MAKAKAQPKQAAGEEASQAPAKANRNGSKPTHEPASTTASYFRALFKENPKLLKGRSNDELLKRWLADHPGETEVPAKVKANLANIKSVLRNKQRKKADQKAGQAYERPGTTQGQEGHGIMARHARELPRSAGNPLEQLEEQIDECLTLAKNLDRDGLEHVIRLLRSARNDVVWRLGQ